MYSVSFASHNMMKKSVKIALLEITVTNSQWLTEIKPKSQIGKV